MDMEIDPEEIAKLIDGVYKNLIEKFNPCATQVIAAGRAYLKALQGLTAASNLFNESLSKIAINAQQSLSSDVGDALLNVVKTQKAIQEHQVNVVKAFYADLLMPLETNLEKDTKVVQSEQKKFLQQHKLILESYCKAATSLKKQRKKKYSSGLTDKELKTLQKVEEEKLKMKQFCNFAFKSVVLQERRRYGFILERQCSIAKHWIVYYETGKRLFEDKLDDFIQVADTRESFNLNIDKYFTKKNEELKDSVTANLRKTRSMDVASSDWISNNERDEFNQNSLIRPKSEDNLTTNSSADETVSNKIEIVDAVFTYEASGKNQLSFEEGDRIALVGNCANGWQFGENLRTQMLGWFPETYIEYENIRKRDIQSTERISTSTLKTNRELEQVSNSRIFGDTLVLQTTKYFQNISSSGLRTSPPSVLPPPAPNTSQYQLNSNQIYSNPMDHYILEKSKFNTAQGNKILQNKQSEINMNNDSAIFPPPQPEIDYSDEEKSMKPQLRNKNFELEASRKPASLESIHSNIKIPKNRKENFIKRTKSFWRSKKVEDPQNENSLWKHKDIIKKIIPTSTNKDETLNRHNQRNVQRNTKMNHIERKSQNLSRNNNNNGKKRNSNNIGNKDNINLKNKNLNFNDDDSDNTAKLLETQSFDDSGTHNIIKTVTRREILKQYYSSDSESEKISRTSDQYDCIIIDDHLVRDKCEFKSFGSNVNSSREINLIDACSNNTLTNATLLPRTKLNKSTKFNTTSKIIDNNNDNTQYIDGSLSKAYGPWYNLWEEQNADVKNTLNC